jgi:hypothetical protein
VDNELMPPIPAIQILEKNSVACLLGVRFWDSVTRSSVGQGLRVTARPAGANRSTGERIATLTPSNVFAFHRLPGTRDIESEAANPGFWSLAGSLQPRKFMVEMTDPSGHFLPCTFQAEAPNRGLFAFPSPSPQSPATSGLGTTTLYVPLFSSPARAVPGGMAVVRGQIQSYLDDQPARFALVEIEAKSASGPPILAHGVADEHGRVALIFPYPEVPPPAAFGSPPANGVENLAAREWTVTVRVFWGPVPTQGGLPELQDVLYAQPERMVLGATSPPAPFAPQTIRFGRDLILRSSGDDSFSALLINAAASPP